jgi:hypothetical protein
VTSQDLYYIFIISVLVKKAMDWAAMDWAAKHYQMPPQRYMKIARKRDHRNPLLHSLIEPEQKLYAVRHH